MSKTVTAPGLVITRPNPDRADGAVFAQLKDMSTGHCARQLLGQHHAQILESLFLDANTIQSHTRTWFAMLNDNVVGQITCVSGDEFPARQRATLAVIRRVSSLSAIRVRCQVALRFLQGTRLGPYAVDQSHIASLAVRSDARRRGIATALIKYVCRQATAAGNRQMTLDVATANSPAIAFYLANGFSVAVAKRGNLKLARTLETTVS